VTGFEEEGRKGKGREGMITRGCTGRVLRGGWAERGEVGRKEIREEGVEWSEVEVRQSVYQSPCFGCL
jgi:hypothetical protein